MSDDWDLENQPYVSPKSIVRVWHMADYGALFVVCEELKKLPQNAIWPVLEGPEERCDLEGVLLTVSADETKRESVVRVFVTPEEATSYLDIVAESQLPEDPPVSIKRVSLKSLFSMRDSLSDLSRTRHGAPCRIDVCSMEGLEWPVRVDTLWAEKTKPN